MKSKLGKRERFGREFGKRGAREVERGVKNGKLKISEIVRPVKWSD